MKVIIPNPAKIKLNGYYPLRYNEFGRWAIKQHGLHPYLDGSCRREPDLEHMFPSITALCRKETFAPHLHENDIVAYAAFSEYGLPHDYKHMVAILRVVKRCESHKEAAEWYRVRDLRLPANCMVSGNAPVIFSKTNTKKWSRKRQREFMALPHKRQEVKGTAHVKKWDEDCQAVASHYPVFLICRSIYNAVLDDIHTPPRLSSEVCCEIFDKPKLTLQTANNITFQQLQGLGKMVSIDFRLE